MTSLQDATVKEFEREVKKRGRSYVMDWKESTCTESYGILFAAADCVTLMVYHDGLISIPAVRTYHPPEYPTPIIAAAGATELWAKQRARDEANPDLAKSRTTGHLGSAVDPSLKCCNELCPCHEENSELRQRRARGGFNWDREKCS